MGRVRRYHKIKAIDPFSKSRGVDIYGGKKSSVQYDEPPELFEERKDQKKRKIRSWDVEEDREILMQREALRSLRKEGKAVELLPSGNKKGGNKSSDTAVKKIEGKKEDESMKDFKARVRQETRITLRDELQSITKTAKKRKLRLKERKMKNKGGNSNNGNDDDDDIMDNIDAREFNQSESGKLR